MFDAPKKGYVADEVGYEYVKWERGDMVTLTAPTGSGKTYFVLSRLLPFAMANKRRILYLVNRKALKAQIEEDITKINYKYLREGYGDTRDCIKVMTYQHLEQNIKKRTLNLQKYNEEVRNRLSQIQYIRRMHGSSEGNEWTAEVLRLEREIENLKKFYFLKNQYDSPDYYYIICDEAHYFLTDALFNTNTEISYNWVRERNKDAVLIMISATLENIVRMDLPEWNLTYQSKLHAISYSNSVKSYSIPRDYSYIKLHAFDTPENIINLIRENEHSGKWLIFWNDIKQGEELAKTLADNNIDAIFIDSSYGEDEDTSASVEKIAREKEMSHDVIIATATLDNGISIQDRNLRNIIVMADNKEEFIQMLGRKRTDGKFVNLYVCRRSAGEFKRRKGFLERCMKAYETCRQMIGYPGVYSFDGYDKMQQAALSEKILGNPQFYAEVRKFLYPTVQENIPFNVGVVYKISALSIVSLTNQIQFYDEQIKRFEIEGEDAFLRTQLEWLEISDIEECINDLKLGKEEKLRAEIDAILVGYIDRKMAKDENIELREKISGILRSLLNVCISEVEQTEDMIRRQRSIIKNDRPFSEKEWNTYMLDIGLPYRMEKTDAKTYVIKKLAEK